MKTQKRKITPHTIFIYSHGNFLRVVRGDHVPPDIQSSPRIYDSLTEALGSERRSRVLNALRLFPSDKVLDRRLKKAVEPVKIESHRQLSDMIKSSLFLFAQIGYDVKYQEVAYIYHRDPVAPRGLTMVKTGKVNVVRQLLKRFKKPKIRELDYREHKPRTSMKQDTA